MLTNSFLALENSISLNSQQYSLPQPEQTDTQITKNKQPQNKEKPGLLQGPNQSKREKVSPSPDPQQP